MNKYNICENILYLAEDILADQCLCGVTDSVYRIGIPTKRGVDYWDIPVDMDIIGQKTDVYLAEENIVSIAAENANPLTMLDDLVDMILEYVNTHDPVGSVDPAIEYGLLSREAIIDDYKLIVKPYKSAVNKVGDLLNRKKILSQIMKRSQQMSSVLPDVVTMIRCHAIVKQAAKSFGVDPEHVIKLVESEANHAGVIYTPKERPLETCSLIALAAERINNAYFALKRSGVMGEPITTRSGIMYVSANLGAAYLENGGMLTAIHKDDSTIWSAEKGIPLVINGKDVATQDIDSKDIKKLEEILSLPS